MKKPLLLLFISFIFYTGFLSCRKDDSPKTADKFDLFLINNTKQDLDIHISVDMDEDGFVDEGNLSSGESRTISDLIVGITYTVKLAYTGTKPNKEDNIYERFTFTNDSSSDAVITREIN